MVRQLMNRRRKRRVGPAPAAGRVRDSTGGARPSGDGPGMAPGYGSGIALARWLLGKARRLGGRCAAGPVHGGALTGSLAAAPEPLGHHEDFANTQPGIALVTAGPPGH